MLSFTYWQENKHWLGYLNDYLDYLMQGKSFEQLQENLKDIQKESSSIC